jgi:hypothetical protein
MGMEWMQPANLNESFNIRTLKKTYTAPVSFGIIRLTLRGESSGTGCGFVNGNGGCRQKYFALKGSDLKALLM